MNQNLINFIHYLTERYIWSAGDRQSTFYLNIVRKMFMRFQQLSLVASRFGDLAGLQQTRSLRRPQLAIPKLPDKGNRQQWILAAGAKNQMVRR